jgi:uncharacterized membrane protein YpjA
VAAQRVAVALLNRNDLGRYLCLIFLLCVDDKNTGTLFLTQVLFLFLPRKDQKSLWLK